jgi:hypothetical protein
MPASRPSFWRGRSAQRSRPRRRPGALRRLASFAAAVTLMSLVTLGVVHILSNVARSREFQVRALAFTRASDSLKARLRSRLNGLVGANLFAVDLATAARAVEQDPWVRRAVVKRWLPGTLQVTVEERRPVALGEYRGRTMLVDSEGWPIEEAPTPRPAMPRLTGIPARDPEAFSRLAVEGLEALSLVAGAAPALLEGLEEVDLSVPGAVLLRRGKDRPEIWLDRFDAARNLENYRRIRADIERRFKSVAAVDLRWRDQIILRPGNGGGSLE